MSPAQNSDGLAGAHASIGRLKRLVAEFDAVNPSIGQADCRSAFEKLLLEILAAVEWREGQATIGSSQFSFGLLQALLEAVLLPAKLQPVNTFAKPLMTSSS